MELTAELSLSGLPSLDLRTKILSIIFGFPLSSLSLSLSGFLSLFLSPLLLLKLLIGRAEAVYAGEEELRGLLTRKQRGIFPGGGPTCRCSAVDYPVAKREAQNS